MNKLCPRCGALAYPYFYCRVHRVRPVEFIDIDALDPNNMSTDEKLADDITADALRGHWGE